MNGGNKIKLYYDNELVANGKGTYNTLLGGLVIGGHEEDDMTFYVGDIGEVRVYSSALTNEQINTIYEYGKQKYYSNND